MRIAFYAPLKAPDSPVPSGDRRIARLLIRALESCGHDVALLSRFRAFEGGGDAARAKRLRAAGLRLGARAARRLRARPAGERPEAMFTYHVYDKAPDWIGPQVAAALDIPYLVCEATLNRARAKGALEIGYHGTREALAAADAVLELNPADRPEVAAALKPGATIWQLAPFLDDSEMPAAAAVPPRGPVRAKLAAAHGLAAELPWLLSVAMMRPGDKLKSYRIMAEALSRLTDRPWQLLVAGDGPARAEVEATFRPLGRDRVRFLGLREGDELAELYAACDIFAWPAVNEALGMAILEAQAAGLPAVAGARAAIATIIEDGVTGMLTPEGDGAAFGAALALLFDAPDRAAEMGRAARAKARRQHGIAAASKTLNAALSAAVRHRPDSIRETA
ncbi:MAG: glycosyltransferase family 4 protein [Alphaproteobacteria bacterium]|nr:glycosyltransferase family 4 protein [Alphaproteobacteria bacterium]